MSEIGKVIGYILDNLVKLILIALCVGLALAQVSYLHALPGLSGVNTIAPGSVGAIHYLLSGGFLLLAALGAYATITGDRQHLRNFTIGAAIYSIATIALAYLTMGPGAAETINNDFLKRFVDLAPDYKWDKKSGTNSATEMIDGIQKRLECCGSTGNEFWKAYQKPPITADQWPSTCCNHPDETTGLCLKSKETLYGNCLERLSNVEKSNMLMFVLFIAWQILLCLISLCVKSSL